MISVGSSLRKHGRKCECEGPHCDPRTWTQGRHHRTAFPDRSRRCSRRIARWVSHQHDQHGGRQKRLCGRVHVEEGRFDLAAAFDARFVQSERLPRSRRCRCVADKPDSRRFPNLKTRSWKGTPFLTRQPKNIAGHRWFAVGDAAGYVEPFTGEGIAWAMNGALALAPIALNAVTGWKDAHARLWTRMHARLVGRRQLQCRVLAKVLRSQRLSSWMVRALALCPALATPFVRNLSRPTTRFRGVAS